MRVSSILSAAMSASAVSAVYQGFNYGSTKTDGSVKSQADFEAEFRTAQGLVGTSGFTSARLYTMVQAGTANTPISAIQAAINTKTTLLLGLWASAGQAGIDNEIAALKTAISTYGSAFTSLVAGISVGSEDLYRITPTGIAAKSGYGADPAVLVSYISQVRSALSGTALSSAKLGHVDTWTAWVNGSNSAVISAVDWLGFDGYPYFQNTQANGIENAKALFQESFSATVAVAGGKDVWITETGWPVSGSVSGSAVASLANAKTYWDEVGCPSFGKVNTFWFTLQDSQPTTPNPSFGIVGSTLTTTPLFDLSCSAVSSSSSSSASASSTAPSSAASSRVSSASSAATALASNGGGLVPSAGAGNGVPASVASTPTSAAGSSVRSSGTAPSTITIATSVTASTTATGVVVTTAAASTSTSPAFTGAASANAGTVAGGIFGAIVAILAAF